MTFSITINGREHTLNFDLHNGLSCLLDGIPFPAEIAEVQPGVYSVLLGGKSFAARVDLVNSPQSEANAGGGAANGGEYAVHVDGVCYTVSVRDPRRRRNDRTRLALGGRQTVKAPMPGKVIRVLVSEGQAVDAGQGLIVVEAMKMQNEIKCPKAGSVQKVLVGEGQAVNAGETLVIVD
ncbi:MAG: biotin/lipoyl-containing protein [Terriglobia bacterium]